jgi:hypothetical protein
MRAGLVSKEVADRFVEALRKLEEDRDVEALVEIHAEDCDAGNVCQHAQPFWLRSCQHGGCAALSQHVSTSAS